MGDSATECMTSAAGVILAPAAGCYGGESDRPTLSPSAGKSGASADPVRAVFGMGAPGGNTNDALRVSDAHIGEEVCHRATGPSPGTGTAGAPAFGMRKLRWRATSKRLAACTGAAPRLLRLRGGAANAHAVVGALKVPASLVPGRAGAAMRLPSMKTHQSN